MYEFNVSESNESKRLHAERKKKKRKKKARIDISQKLLLKQLSQMILRIQQLNLKVYCIAWSYRNT